MKEQYFGDERDFKKYGLIRGLLARTHATLGVNWLLTGPDNSGQGKTVSYLERPDKYRHVDPELFTALKILVPLRAQDRTHPTRLLMFQQAGLLPNAKFYSEQWDGAKSVEARKQLLQSASKQLGHTNLVFLDPDNGFEVKSAQQVWKYVLWDEVGFFLERSSVLIYQHRPHVTNMEMLLEKKEQIMQRFSPAGLAVFQDRDVSFFLICRAEHQPWIFSRAYELGRYLGFADVKLFTR